MTGTMSLVEFCERLKVDGAYIGDDWHVHRKDGRPLNKLMPNGYYTVRKQCDGHEYNYMEHRVIWCMINGDIPDGLQINHKDFNRGNNNIDNLELMTAKENLRYSVDAGRLNTCKGEKSGKAIYSNKDAQAMRWLKNHGWGYREITKLFGGKSEYCISRIIRGVRYGSVPNADNVASVYPTIVNRAKSGMSAEESLFELKSDMDALAKICDDDSDANTVMQKIGDVLCNVVFLGSGLGIDMTECLMRRR